MLRRNTSIITVDKLIATPKDELPAISKELDSDDAHLLVEWLSVKDDKPRYPSLLDIINILLLIRKTQKSDDIESFISKALLGGILDSKSKKVVQAELLS